jgi:hypothetical protein
MYKRVEPRPEWLEAANVADIYSLSGCISEYFADYIPFWKHNGFWLFDSPAIIKQVATDQGISLEGLRLFYYEAHASEYDREKRAWVPFEPEASFVTSIASPTTKQLEGFDITTFSVHTSPECSPLSCNSCATTIETNSHCLMESFDDAKRVLEEDLLGPCEQGPYRIIAVYAVDDA